MKSFQVITREVRVNIEQCWGPPICSLLSNAWRILRATRWNRELEETVLKGHITILREKQRRWEIGEGKILYRCQPIVFTATQLTMKRDKRCIISLTNCYKLSHCSWFDRWLCYHRPFYPQYILYRIFYSNNLSPYLQLNILYYKMR